METADKLEKIAKAIEETLYHHSIEMSKYGANRKIMNDDADYLRELAKKLRGKSGQFAHELDRETLPWEPAK